MTHTEPLAPVARTRTVSSLQAVSGPVNKSVRRRAEAALPKESSESRDSGCALG